MNEAPSDILFLPHADILEGSGPGTEVLKFTLDDPDGPLSTPCEIVEDYVPFELKSNDTMFSVVVARNQWLDYEERAEYRFEIFCVDEEFMIGKVMIPTIFTSLKKIIYHLNFNLISYIYLFCNVHGKSGYIILRGFLCRIQNITVSVTDVNEAPVSLELLGTGTIPTNGSVGYKIGKIVVIDPDMGQHHTVVAIGRNSDIIKVINSESYIMQIIGRLFIESKQLIRWVD